VLVSYLLKRHLVPVRAHFDFSLVLAYALPERDLEPFLAPGLVLDTYDSYGFFVIALVKTRRLRPGFLPGILGLDFLLSGYRVFVRHRTREGRTLRGLRIVRSDTDSRAMATLGNALTHYNYARSDWTVGRTRERLAIDVRTPGAVADLSVAADLTTSIDSPPIGSPFPDLKTARRFAGPMPFTFDYEPQTNSIVRVEGVRTHWNPRPIHVDVTKATYLDRFARDGVRPILANAFVLEDVPYRWRAGVREPL
jgi:hypothetical protein